MISNLFQEISLYLSQVSSRDLINLFKYIVDISIVSYLIYKIIIVVRQTRAGQLIKGIAILLVATQLSGWLGLNTINFILRNTMTVGLIAVLVVFQPELRGALERIGRSRFGSLFSFDEGSLYTKQIAVIDEVVKACENMSKANIGALIVIERETKLGDITKTGIEVNASVSSELLENIFFPHAPLHDGALVISNGRVKAAGCFLPLTENRSLSSELGTRHRAALGVTENSDAIVIIVSEETGRISLAIEGVLTRNYVPDTLKKALAKVLLPEQDAKSKITIWKGRNVWKRVE